MLKELQTEKCTYGLVEACDKFYAGTNCVYSADIKYLGMWNKPVEGFLYFTCLTVIYGAGTFYSVPVK